MGSNRFFAKKIESSGQSYKYFMLVNYDSRVLMNWQFSGEYDSIGIIYERKGFIRLITGADVKNKF